MTNMKWITLGIALVSVSLTMAQQTEIIRERTPLPPVAPPPPDTDVFIDQNIAAAVTEQRARIAATADRVSEAAKARAGVEKRMMLAQSGGGGGYTPEFGVASHQRSPRVMVIPKDANDAKSIGEVEEDVGVMAHILDKAVNSRDKASRAMGIAVFVSMGTAAPQHLYIEGHGAIFQLNVNYPLLPPPAKEDKEEAKKPENNEWEEARREMTRSGKGQAGVDPLVAFEERFVSDGGWNGKFHAEEYDADKVEDLKKDIISALKNAANIRRLKSDETVTVVVTGAGASVVTKTSKSTVAKPGAGRSERVMIAKAASGERTRVGDPARLIIRARKADAEAFQAGKLDFDAFCKKAAVMVF